MLCWLKLCELQLLSEDIGSKTYIYMYSIRFTQL